jgi:hypothetical protein
MTVMGRIGKYCTEEHRSYISRCKEDDLEATVKKGSGVANHFDTVVH